MLKPSWRPTRCSWLAVLPVLAIETVLTVGHASAAVIYEDTFARGTAGAPLALGGSQPSPTNTGSATWTEFHSGTSLTTDGSSAIAPASGTTTASLPFTPTANTVYTLSVTLTPTGASTNWIAIGFGGTATSSSSMTSSSTMAWVAYRSSGVIATWYGGGTSNVLSYNAGSGTQTSDTLTITLNSGTGEVIFSDSLGRITTPRSVNLTSTQITSMTAILIASSNSSGTFQDLKLSDSSPVPEPAGFALAALGGVSLLLCRRKRS